MYLTCADDPETAAFNTLPRSPFPVRVEVPGDAQSAMGRGHRIGRVYFSLATEYEGCLWLCMLPATEADNFLAELSNAEGLTPEFKRDEKRDVCVTGEPFTAPLFIDTWRSWTFRRVLMTSRGVVANPAAAPEKNPLTTKVAKLNSPEGFMTRRKLSFAAIELAANGIFIAKVVGKLRNNAMGPSTL